MLHRALGVEGKVLRRRKPVVCAGSTPINWRLCPCPLVHDVHVQHVHVPACALQSYSAVAPAYLVAANDQKNIVKFFLRQVLLRDGPHGPHLFERVGGDGIVRPGFEV